MRVILSCLGSIGDVFPVLGFGRALAERGHSVVVLTTPYYEPDVHQAGLEYAALCDQETQDRMASELRKTVGRLPTPLARKLMAEGRERTYRYIESEKERNPDTVFAATPLFTHGAGSAAQAKLGVPYVSMFHSLILFRIAYPSIPAWTGFYQLAGIVAGLSAQSRGARQLRRQLKLPRGALRGPGLVVALFPRWFVPWFTERRGGSVTFTDFPLYQRNQDEALPPEVEAFIEDGPPPILFSSTSWEEGLGDYFAASTRACESLGKRGILLSNKPQDIIRESKPVLHAGFLPLNRLLPRALAIVHHGGFGTIAASLAAGVPQLAVPWNTDQPYNARHLRQFGVSMTLRPRDYAGEVTPALRQLLDSHAIRASCEEIRDRIPESPDFSAAIDRMEALSRAALQASR